MSPIAVFIVLIAVVLTAVISVFATIAYRKSVSEAKVGSAEEKAREILDDALKTAEAKNREVLPAPHCRLPILLPSRVFRM